MLEHGAYWLLLTAYYSSGKPLPSEAIRIMRIVGASTTDEVKATTHVLETYFTLEGDEYRHERADAEIAKRDNYHNALSEAGRKGGLSKATRVATSLAVASPQPQPQPQSYPQSHPKESTTTAPKPAASTPKQNGHKILFDSEKGCFAGISEEQELLWQDAYPAVPIPPAISQAAAWAKANPANRKSNWERFLVNWFSRAQDRASRVKR